MNQTIISIRALDVHYIFYGLEYLALVVLIIIIGANLSKRPNFIDKKYKTIYGLFVGLLAVSMVGLYATDLYNYLHSTRPGYVQINQQIKHNTTGL
jgi:hypothetical protein